MTTDRPYRKALSEDEALKEITRMSGVQFRPDLVRVFIEQMEKHRVHKAPQSILKLV